MVIKKPDDVHSSEITDEKTYLNRRTFMRAGVLAATTMATGLAYRKLNTTVQKTTLTPELSNVAQVAPSSAPSDDAMARAFRTDEAKTSYADITHYNNFYEFSTGKQEVAEVAGDFVARPWTVEVSGLCGKPRTFDLDEILKIAPAEERIYRMRCVEAWSMVIPWNGFPLAKLLESVEPLSSAKYVAFQTLLDPRRMPGQRQAVLDWPYVEGLRMDEAMHPLAILASGLYGRQMPPQDGAPLRLVTPWKYGFKGIKSIVKIKLVAEQPPTTWNIANRREYGFYSNVNPNVNHPRWSQATERRIGEAGERQTLMFNGYGEQVAHLYAGMDLVANY